MDAKTCRCTGCGAPLPLKKEKDGVVKCEYCGTKTYVSGLEDDGVPKYQEPPRSGKELIGRFFELKKDKQENIMMNIIMVIIFGGMMLALITNAICGG